MDEERPEEGAEDERDALLKRFPNLPPSVETPELPSLQPKLPPHPEMSPKPGSATPGGYNKMAIAATAATSFIMPLLVLSVGGFWLDTRMRHSVPWFAVIGLIVGLVLGTSSLLNIVKRLSD